jgi:hypothetical protein
MTPEASGTIAAVNILICVLAALWMFIPAAYGGFNATALSVYATLGVSVAASFYLNTQRRELSSSGRNILCLVLLGCFLLVVSLLVL